MSLYLCNKSPAENSALRSCLTIASNGRNNAVLLMENAVYAALPNVARSLSLQATAASVPLYALKDDLQARGVTPLAVDYVTPIDYSEFVRLCVTHKNTHSWY